MSNIYHVTTQLGRMDSFFLEADNYNDIVNLLTEISEADIINIKKIIYSKKFGVNTNEIINEFPNYEDSIYKWSFFCYSNNHTKQIDLYNLKPHTTREDIEKFLKTQLIVNEPIIGFYDDVKTEFKDTSIFDENLYQVVYKLNSRTYTENFYSKNLEELKRFFNNYVAGELVEIRDFEYSGLSLKEDDGNYYKRISFKIIDTNKESLSFIPKVKKTKDLKIIKQTILNYLKFNNKKIKDDKIAFYLKD